MNTLQHSEGLSMLLIPKILNDDDHFTVGIMLKNYTLMDELTYRITLKIENKMTTGPGVFQSSMNEAIRALRIKIHGD